MSISMTIEDELRAAVGEDELLLAEAIPEDYGVDELASQAHMPDAVVLASSTATVSRVMACADRHRVPVLARGAGTGLVGGAVAVHGGIVLDTTRMNRVLEIDRDNLTMTVEPGLRLMEIAEALRGTGLFYAPDPGEKSATIGGNISTNAGGMRAVKYGVTRDHVRALEVVLADGTVMELGGKVVKNSSGYALKDLFIGSEGTLGIITRATLRLLPEPQRVVSLLVPFADLRTAIEAVPLIIRSRCQPTAVEYMVKEVIADAEEFLGKAFPDSSADAYLLLKFDGDDAGELEVLCDRAAQICLDAGAIDVLISNTPEREEAIWTARGAFLEAIKAGTSEMDECDVVVPLDAVATFVTEADALQAEFGLRIKGFGHAGDGNLHLYILRDERDEADWRLRLAAVFERLYARAAALGGQVSGEHGIGLAKRPFLDDAMGEVRMELMRRIKAAFDPHGIVNPGKVC